jgi:hypothetical protein
MGLARLRRDKPAIARALDRDCGPTAARLQQGQWLALHV